MTFVTKNKKFIYKKKPFLMGILNVTPDSFSDGGKYTSAEYAKNEAIKMLNNGADIIDIGGESTRPGAEEISIDEEIHRVVPVIKLIKRESQECSISIDTRKSQVAEAAIEAGADIINDISGLQFDPKIADIAAKYNCGLILMHMRGNPDTMQNMENTTYSDLTKEVNDFLVNAADTAINKGVKINSIILDPGIGFSKTFSQNIELIKNIDIIKESNYPILVGPSRKSFIGEILKENNPIKRNWGTAGAIAWLASKNVEFLRIHDVKEINQLLTVLSTFK